MNDISIIIASNDPKNLVRTLAFVKNQSISGISYEIMIIQESNDGFNKFNIINCPINATIFRQKLNFDFGAKAHDVGIRNSNSEYVIFWDDDNVYYSHALVSQFINASGNDIGISKIKHKNSIIPIFNRISPGDIDTMCFCVKRELAITASWSDGGGRYSDYRWISKIAENAKISYSKVIIGEHL